jgi:3'(2'), 5'-bisphosphate nucleotidase
LLESVVTLPVSKDRSIPPVVIVASRSHFSPETADYVERAKSEHGEVKLVSAGSALKICLVAEGTADCYPRFGPTMEWDVGAGQAIAEEAGCTVVNTETGKPLRYNKENLLNPFFIVER